MKEYTIGQISSILKIKPHIIRYWERELPFISPRKSLSGRRVYSERELQLLSRLKYLIYEKGYTVSGAGERIWEDITGENRDVIAEIGMVRRELLNILSNLTFRRFLRSMEDVIKRFKEIGQGHLFAFWERRPNLEKETLISDLKALDISLIDSLKMRLREAKPAKPDFKPVDYVSVDRARADEDALRVGDEFIRSGKTCFLTVAGGQGSRLGFDGPKGMFKISPIRRASLFQIFAEKILFANRKYGLKMPWLIMTSPLNHEDTKNFFEEKNYFGLDRESVYFFNQGVLPSMYPDGRLVLDVDGGLFKNPNGHGGVISALKDSGLIKKLKDMGIEEIFYFQVDNPLVNIPDPLFLGWHIKEGSEMSSKVIKKAFPEEKLGSIGLINGKPGVIEYSDLDRELMYLKDERGELLYSQGSIAVHILNVRFIESQHGKLPYHLARKKVKALIPTERGTEIKEEEVIKFEMFLFDAIPAARNPLFFETERREEFSPLKNREGVDSIATCIRGQIEKYAFWLERLGVKVPRNEGGESIYAIEISPLFAPSFEDLRVKKDELPGEIDQDILIE